MNAHEEMLRRTRRIDLRGELSDERAQGVIAQLLFLASLDSNTPITLSIDSPGGPAVPGLAVVDAMKNLAPHVRTVVERQAAGTAALVLASGDIGLRVARPSARITLLDIDSTTVPAGMSEPAFRAEVARLRNDLLTVLSKAVGKSVEQILHDGVLKSGHAFDAEAAKRYGLVDEVIEGV
jgi:ATP-dependent Clp protease protease subunit